MSSKPEHYYTSPSAEKFAEYLRPNSKIPTTPSKLSISIVSGENRKFNTATTGDWSLVVSYKNKPGFIASASDDNDTLVIQQLQGVEPAGYRLATGMLLVPLVCDQLVEIVSHPQSPYTSLAIPSLNLIAGILDAEEGGERRYRQAISHLKLSKDENLDRYQRTIRSLQE